MSHRIWIIEKVNKNVHFIRNKLKKKKIVIAELRIIISRTLHPKLKPRLKFKRPIVIFLCLNPFRGV